MDKSSFSSSAGTRILFVAILFLLPTIVFGEGEAEQGNKSLALKYKVAAIASILVASAIGVWLPMVGKRFPALSPERDFFFIVKAFAAGVILSTGFIHVLPDAFEWLTSSSLSKAPWGDFPFAGFIAMVSAIGTLMVDAYATSYYGKRSREKPEGTGGATDEERAVAVHSHATHGHAHGWTSLEMDSDKTELLRHRVISQVLELGIIVHSVIIGITLGVSRTPKEIRPLLAAMTFHQFFEGIGLGGCIAQAKFKSRAVATMTLFFSITTPIGIAIGIVITDNYKETSSTALILQGVFNAASAGILIYMALVDLLSADFMNPRMQSNGKLQLGANVSLLIGAGFMAFLAKWA